MTNGGDPEWVSKNSFSDAVQVLIDSVQSKKKLLEAQAYVDEISSSFEQNGTPGDKLYEFGEAVEGARERLDTNTPWLDIWTGAVERSIPYRQIWRVKLASMSSNVELKRQILSFK